MARAVRTAAGPVRAVHAGKPLATAVEVQDGLARRQMYEDYCSPKRGEQLSSYICLLERPSSACTAVARGLPYMDRPYGARGRTARAILTYWVGVLQDVLAA